MDRINRMAKQGWPARSTIGAKAESKKAGKRKRKRRSDGVPVKKVLPRIANFRGLDGMNGCKNGWVDYWMDQWEDGRRLNGDEDRGIHRDWTG